MLYDARIAEEVRKIMLWLSEHSYDEIEAYTKGVRLHAAEIRYSVGEYGRTIIVPPDHIVELLDIVEVNNANPKEWSVRCPVWTDEEGRSDLTLELSVVVRRGGTLRTEIDNLVVL